MDKRTPDLTVLSLGAGVQSTALLLMALHGEFDRLPDCAIFADTGWEPQTVYTHLDWLEREVAGRIPIHRVSRGNIFGEVLAHVREGARVSNPPFYIKNADGTGGILRRGCTYEYKVRPKEAKIRDLLGVPKGRQVRGKLVEQWYGISMDEVQRMKDSDVGWITNRYPLIDKGLSRHGCLIWLKNHGYPPPPKSACIGCPFHSDRMWRELKRIRPDEWAQAVEWDAAVRTGMKGVDGEAYLHRSLLPLDQVDLRTTREKGQSTLWDDEEDGFGNECGGHCGV